MFIWLICSDVHEITATWCEIQTYLSVLFKPIFYLTGWYIFVRFSEDGWILFTMIKNHQGYDISMCTLPMQGKHYSEMIFGIFNPVSSNAIGTPDQFYFTTYLQKQQHCHQFERVLNYTTYYPRHPEYQRKLNTVFVCESILKTSLSVAVSANECELENWWPKVAEYLRLGHVLSVLSLKSTAHLNQT